MGFNLETPENENYSATVVRIELIVPLEDGDMGKQKCDSVVGTPLLGFQAIVGKDTEVGDLGIVFTAETQLSQEFARANNLYRDSDLNQDKTKVGYIDKSGRVKAMKFRGHRSDALFMPLTSLEYTKVDISQLEEGDVFDKIKGNDICKKYVVKVAKPRVEKNKEKVFKRVDEKFLPEHYDTNNYFRNKTAIKGNVNIVVTQKLHGTSIRLGNTIVKRELNIGERVLKKLGIKIQEKEFDHVYGSRKVIKDSNNPRSNHFHGSDIYSEEGKKYDSMIPENFIVYGELVGYTSDGKALQPKYGYNLPVGTNELYVYRVAIVTNQGMMVDLSWGQVKEFCRDRGLKHVPELWAGKHMYFRAEEWLDKKYTEEGYKQAVTLDPQSPCDEGVCVRVDGIAPYILKAKSPLFFVHESEQNDAGVVDIEELAKETGV